MAYQIAEVHAWRGGSVAAFEWLQRSYDERHAGTLGILIDPLLNSLHDDPRFDAMLTRMGLRK